MGSEANPIGEYGSEPTSPTVEELVLQLQSSFFPLEFQYVAQTLKNREQRLKETHVLLITKAEEEKNVILSENVKLKDELKAMKKVNTEYERKFRVLSHDFKEQRKKFDGMKKVNAEYEGKFRVLNDEFKKQQNDIDVKNKVNAEYENKLSVLNCDLKKQQNEIDEYEMKVMGLNDELKKQQSEIDAMRKVNAEYEGKFRKLQNDIDAKRKASGEYEGKLMVLNDEVKKQQIEIEAMRKLIVKYESQGLSSIGSGKEQKESYRPPLFSEKKDSMQKTEPKMQEIIQIDDDDDDLEFISTNKRSRFSDDTKIELKYSSASRFLNTCRKKCDPLFSNFKSQEKRLDD